MSSSNYSRDQIADGLQIYGDLSMNDNDIVKANGVWTHLDHYHAISSVSSVDFESLITTEYDVFKVEFYDIYPATDNVSFQMLVSSNNGISYDNAVNNYGYSIIARDCVGDKSAQSTASTALILAQNVDDGATIKQPLSGSIIFYNPLSAVNRFACQTELTYGHNTSAEVCRVNGCGQRESTEAISAIRLMFSSGNISSGNIVFYGMVV